MTYSSEATSSHAGFSVDRALRKLFPSTSKLTFEPGYSGRFLQNISDLIPMLLYPEFRTLPPNHLRIRVSMRRQSRIQQPDALFSPRIADFWMFALGEGVVKLNSNILRYRCWLRPLGPLDARLQFSADGASAGSMPESISTMKRSSGASQELQDENRFRFHHSTDSSVSYNQEGVAPTSYSQIPEADSTFDLVFSNSLLDSSARGGTRQLSARDLPTTAAWRHDDAFPLQYGAPAQRAMVRDTLSAIALAMLTLSPKNSRKRLLPTTPAIY